MEQLIREFGVWLKQGFGWLVDVIVFGCLWGILLIVLYLFYWVFGRLIGLIRWALDRIAYALGVILFSAAVVSGAFASAGLVAAVAIWLIGNITLASR
jgi:hypothetical protein